MRRKTHEEFIERLLIKSSHYREGKFEILGRYDCSSCPIEVKTKYGVCEITPSDLYQNYMPTIKAAVCKEEFLISMFKDKRDILYDYSKIIYKNQKTPIEIVCGAHGSFWQSPDAHKKGHGCPKCHQERVRIGLCEIKKRLKEKGSGMTYDLEGVVGVSDYVSIICEHGHPFRQKLTDHLNGNGCPTCANITRAMYHEGLVLGPEVYLIRTNLYLIRLSRGKEVFYKIGVTKNMHNRLQWIKRDANYKTEIIYCEEVSVFEAFRIEAEIIEKYRSKKHLPSKKFGGDSECFTEDILTPYINDWLSNNDYDDRMQEEMRREVGIEDYDPYFNM